MLRWNPEITLKYTALGVRAREQAQGKGRGGKLVALSLQEFIHAAIGASAWSRATVPLVQEARALIARGSTPSSSAARELAARFGAVCRKHGLGDPAVYALATGYVAKTRREGELAELSPAQREPWIFLADAARKVGRKITGKAPPKRNRRA
jgi:hypothetical protein